MCQTQFAWVSACKIFKEHGLHGYRMGAAVHKTVVASFVQREVLREEFPPCLHTSSIDRDNLRSGWERGEKKMRQELCDEPYARVVE